MEEDLQVATHSEVGGLRWGLRAALDQISEAGRRRLVAATAGLSLISLLDVVGVTLLALVGAVTVSLVYPDASPLGTAQTLGDWFGSPTTAIAVVVLVAVSVLTLKSALSWAMYGRILRFLARQQGEVAQRLFTRYMGAPMAEAQQLSMAAAVNGVIFGARASTQLLMASSMLVADIVLVFGLAAILAVSSPLLVAFTVCYFGALALFLSRVVGRRNHTASKKFTESDVELSSAVIQAVGLSRELRVYQLTEERADEVRRRQGFSADAQATLLAWNQVPRYALEIALVVGIAAASALVLATQPPDRAAFNLGLFLVAASRLVPALQRINGSWGQVQVSLGQLTLAVPITNLPQDEITTSRPTERAWSSDDATGEPQGTLILDDITYRYPSGEDDALRRVTVSIPVPARVALVGPSGAGKSTLADIILGLLVPQAGTIRITDRRGIDHPPRVAFVAQDVFLSNGTVRDNVTLQPSGLTQSPDDSGVWRALALAQVDDAVRALPQGLDTELGERGVRLSGGQRQRLGLARALYREPDLLVLDEATSALDAETETSVTAAIRSISQHVTVIAIAHRLATVRDADVICYLKGGRLVATGRFDALASEIPDFARAAQLQGLLSDPSFQEEEASRVATEEA